MISTRKISVRTAENGKEYLGIRLGKAEDEVTQIIIPKYYMPDFEKNIDDLNIAEKKALKNLVKAWQKYQKKVKTKNNGELKGSGINFDFDIVIQLIQDFLEFGLYVELEKHEISSNCGKIDFPRTIKRCTPMILDEGPLYMPYITKVKKIADEDLVRDIQVLVLNDIAKKVGWLLGFNIRLPQGGINISVNKSVIPKLKMAKSNSYNTRKLKLIDSLIGYLSMPSMEGIEANELFVSVVYKFWEDMISDVLGNVSRADLDKMFYVRHRYLNKKTGKISQKHIMKPLMPDSVHKDDSINNITILDSKYYQKGLLPENDDITKQFAYLRKAYAFFGASYEYRNIFVMPTDNSNHYSNLYAIFDEDVMPREDLVPIEVLYLNVSLVVENYIHSMNISALVL